MANSTERIISPTFLFRFSIPCRPVKTLWKVKGVTLPESHRIPCFGELNGEPSFADVHAGWNDEGLVFTLEVTGRKKTLWCREDKPEDSDGLHIWIDTRDTKNIHRASRFCQRLAFLPGGTGPKHELPTAKKVDIRRAREPGRPVQPDVLKIQSKVTATGYSLSGLVPTDALIGYDPDEQSRIGFTYMVADSELGKQYFNVGEEFPFAEDPSLWGTLELTKSKK